MVIMFGAIFIVKRGGLLNDALDDFQINLIFTSRCDHIMSRLQHIKSPAGIPIGMIDNHIHRLLGNLQAGFPQTLF